MLKLILQRVPEQHRFSVCALVSSAFYTAATAATSSMPSLRIKHERVGSFVQWLKQYGSNMSVLQLDVLVPCYRVQSAVLQLPCPGQ